MCNSFATPWTVTGQAALFMGFPRQKCWDGLSFPLPGDLLDPETEPVSSAWQAGSSPLGNLEGQLFIQSTI